METSEVVSPEEPQLSASQPGSVRHNNLLRSGLRIPLIAVIAFAAIQCLFATLDILGAPYTGYDFKAYFAAGLVLRTNPHANIYDPHLAQAIAQAHGAAVPVFMYNYPPLLAILMIPLTLFRYRIALAVWTMVNLGLWLCCAAILLSWFRRTLVFGAAQPVPARELRVTEADGDVSLPPQQQVFAPRLFTLAIVLFLVFSYQPIHQDIALGQVSLVVLLLLLLVPVLIEQGRPALAGSVLALAIWIKLFPVVLILYFLLRGRWRVVSGTVAGLVLLALAQVPIIGVGGVLATRHVLDTGAFQSGQFQNEALARVPLWFAAEFGGRLSPALSLSGDALIGIVSIFFIVGLLRARRWNLPVETQHTIISPQFANRELLGYTWALSAMMLILPFTWEHYDAWLLPAIIVCLGLTVHLCATTGFRDAHGRLRRAVYVLVAIVAAYAVTMHHLPLGYDGTTTFDIGPYLGGFALRPPFMLLRPLGAVLAWVCSGMLFFDAAPLRDLRELHNTAIIREDHIQNPTHPLHLRRATQARVLAVLLAAAVTMQVIITVVITAFNSFQPT